MSSIHVYGSTIKDGPISETDAIILDTQKVLSCYGESKRHTESLGISYSKQFGIESKVARFSQMMGPGIPIGFGIQGAISDFLYNIVNNENLIITTDGKSKRAQGYITDAILGYFYVLFFGENQNVYNVTNMNNLCSTRDLAAEVIKNSKKNLRVVFDSSNYIPQHQQFNAIYLNTVKLEELGWRSQIEFEEMVSRTVRYYEETESNEWWYRDYTKRFLMADPHVVTFANCTKDRLS
jgi:UDP-glucuronate decarboxylase